MHYHTSTLSNTHCTHYQALSTFETHPVFFHLVFQRKDAVTQDSCAVDLDVVALLCRSRGPASRLQLVNGILTESEYACEIG